MELEPRTDAGRGRGSTAAPVRGDLGTGGPRFVQLGGADEESNRRSIRRPAGHAACGVTGAEVAGSHLVLANRPGRGSEIACRAWF